MVAEFHQHPEGFIAVRTPDGDYIDTAVNFAADFGQGVPLLVEGADERIYTQGVRHALMNRQGVVDGGPMPWPWADDIIANVKAALKLQVQRKRDLETRVPNISPELQARIDRRNMLASLEDVEKLFPILQHGSPEEMEDWVERTETKDALKTILKIIAMFTR